VLLNQARAVDKQRLVQKMGIFDPAIMKRVDQSLEISLGLADF